MKYLVIVERRKTGFAAYLPDLPGCVSTGATEAELKANIKEAVEFHIDGLKLEGFPVPLPNSRSAYVEVAA